jgi:transportin-1
MDSYMQALFRLTGDPSKEIRKEVCKAFVSLLEVRYDHLQPHIEDVIKFMLVSTQDDDEFVSLEACEFWPAYCATENADFDILKNFVSVLVPTLLQGMCYTEGNLADLAAEEEELNAREDKAQDIKPRFHKARGGGDDDDDEDGEVATWNLRKCSAASLDQLASVYENDLLVVLLPHIQAKLQDPSWVVRESSILALGAIGEGCYDGIEPYLKELVPYLVALLQDEQPLVRSITCWTLSRYAQWVVAEPDDEKALRPLMVNLLKRVLDPSKSVQEAACSAFATLEEVAGERLLPYLEPILQNLMFAFHQYQTKNILILYDAISTLAEAVRDGLNTPAIVQMLMPPLMER